MNRGEFGQLLDRAIELALNSAREDLGQEVPGSVRIKLYGAGHSGDILDRDSALDTLYISPRTYYRIIDIGFMGAYDGKSLLFVRVSSHEPAEFAKTWNTPEGMGPFKVLRSVVDSTDVGASVNRPGFGGGSGVP